MDASPPLSPLFIAAVEERVGSPFVRTDADSLAAYGSDASKRGHPADLVVLPRATTEVAAIAALCNAEGVPLVVRGGGTGYTGGAVPRQGGVVLSLERLNRIREIDEANLLAVVEPNVVTGDLQDAVEQVGLFYPPDPASLKQSTIGGNVAEGAGGPRAFKYGTTGAYVLGLEAVLATGEVIRTGAKTVKNVVGYDLTRLLVGSEGTLAIITGIVLRLMPKPPAQAALRATFADVRGAVGAVMGLLRERALPAALELLDGETVAAVAEYVGDSALAPPGTGAMLLIEVDGFRGALEEELRRVDSACRSAGALEVLQAFDPEERERLWQARREASTSLKTISSLKYNHDVVVPKGRIPELFELVDALRAKFGIRIPCFGHAGDGNIHVNFMIDPGNPAQVGCVPEAEEMLFRGVVALEGAISGEHGIGFTKAAYLPLQLSAAEIALMKKLKQVFDPNGILNPGKIFPD